MDLLSLFVLGSVRSIDEEYFWITFHPACYHLFFRIIHSDVVCTLDGPISVGGNLVWATLVL